MYLTFIFISTVVDAAVIVVAAVVVVAADALSFLFDHYLFNTFCFCEMISKHSTVKDKQVVIRVSFLNALKRTLHFINVCPNREAVVLNFAFASRQRYESMEGKACSLTENKLGA